MQVEAVSEDVETNQGKPKILKALVIHVASIKAVRDIGKLECAYYVGKYDPCGGIILHKGILHLIVDHAIYKGNRDT